MPSINATSLREELERCESGLIQMKADGKLSPEVQALTQSLLTLVKVLVSIFLEKTTKKTSRNSSKPSSQTDKDETIKATTGSNGRGKNETHRNFLGSEKEEHVTVSQVECCNACGEDLRKTAVKAVERRTLIDIVFKKTVHHVDAEVKDCHSCHSEVKGDFPKDMPGPRQYGNSLKAWVISLVVAQMISLNRVQKMVATVIGSVLSETTILNYIMQLYHALEDWEKSAKATMLLTLAINCDETSLRVNKVNHWIHSYSSGEITLKFLHRKRGREAIDDINIIPCYGGVAIHDCWSSYFGYDKCQHALCGSHLLRELAFIIDSCGYSWARNMKRLLQETCKTVSQRKSKKLTSKEYANLQKRYRNILTRGEKELPEIPQRPHGKRGRIAKTDAHNLLARLREHEEGVLLFAKLPYVSFTNNRAERDLRMDKVKQKVSGGFRNESFAKAYCRISSYLLTMGNRGYNPLVAIQMALGGNAPLET